MESRDQTIPIEGPLSPTLGPLELTNRLATGLAIREDYVVQAVLRRAAGLKPQQPFSLKLDGGEVWMRVGPSQVVLLERSRPNDLPATTLESLRRGDTRIDAALQTAIRVTQATCQADGLSRLLYDPEPLTQAAFQSLEPWAPLLEPFAYGGAIRVAAAMDAMRPRLVRTSSPGRSAADLNTYWKLSRLLGRLTLVACNPAGRPWLEVMARQVDWHTGSPTFRLTRERSLGLVGSAGRTAAAFGPVLVEPYLVRLETARRPEETFDALVGLTAIGLTESGTARAITRELQRILREGTWLSKALSPDTAAATVTALATLNDPEAATNAWRGHPRRQAKALEQRQGLLLADPRLDPLLEAVGLTALPTLIDAPLGAFFSGRAHWIRPLADKTAETIFDRAWAGSPPKGMGRSALPGVRPQAAMLGAASPAWAV